MLEISIALVGLLLAWLTYKKTYLDSPSEEIEHFTLQFKATQSTSLKVREGLIKLSKEHDAGSVIMFAGMTIDSYIILMTETFEKNLSDELYNKVIASKPSKSILKS